MSCDILTGFGSASVSPPEGFALALIPQEFSPKFTKQFVLFPSPLAQNTDFLVLSRIRVCLFLFLYLVSRLFPPKRPYLWPARAPLVIIIKIAFYEASSAPWRNIFPYPPLIVSRRLIVAQ